MIGIGAYGLLRLWMELLTGSYEQYSLYINMWGLATMIYGGAMALMQMTLRRFSLIPVSARWVTYYLVSALKVYSV